MCNHMSSIHKLGITIAYHVVYDIAEVNGLITPTLPGSFSYEAMYMHTKDQKYSNSKYILWHYLMTRRCTVGKFTQVECELITY